MRNWGKSFWGLIGHPHSGLIVGLSSYLFFLALSWFPSWVEAFYSRGLYLGLSWLLSSVSDWVPFSLTNLSFLALTVFCLFPLIYRRKEFSLGNKVLRVVGRLGWVWFLFFALWAANYQREPVGKIFGMNRLKPGSRSKIDPKLLSLLTAKTNEQYPKTLSGGMGCDRFEEDLARVDREIIKAQNKLFARHSLPANRTIRTKKRWPGALWLALGNSGIYGPYTAEPNISWPIAPGMLPALVAHERAHLAGFASEASATFVSILTCLLSDNAQVRYSGYLQLWRLFPKKLRQKAKLDEPIYHDFECIRSFWKNYDVRLARKVSDTVFDLFLKTQGVSSGIANYSQGAVMALYYLESLEEPQ